METKQPLKLAIGCDHAGFTYKTALKEHLTQLGYDILDFGTNSTASVDYPDYIHPLAKTINANERDLGIIICGSGNGVAMTANKYPNVRAAICWQDDIATLARNHNNANIISLPARFITLKKAIQLVDIFVTTSFEGGRHQRRVGKIPCS